MNSNSLMLEQMPTIINDIYHQYNSNFYWKIIINADVLGNSENHQCRIVQQFY